MSFVHRPHRSLHQPTKELRIIDVHDYDAKLRELSFVDNDIKFLTCIVTLCNWHMS
jgi:hypothetical protein